MLLKTLPVIALGAAWLAVTMPASASLVAYDNFESYSPGSLDGGSGGTGWLTNWDADASVSVVNAGLSYSGGAISINGGSNAVRLNDSITQIVDRQFTSFPIATASEVYFSLLFQEVSGGSGDFINFWVSSSENRNLSGGMGLLSIGSENLGARVRSTSDTTDLSTTATTPGETYFLVGRFSRDGTSGNPTDPLRYDLMQLWINPTSLTLGTPDAVVDASSGTNGDIQWFGIRTVGIDGTDEYLFDELRIGTDVLSVVPEPAACVLLGGAFLAFVFRRRQGRG